MRTYLSHALTAIAFLVVFACGFHSLINADYFFHLRGGEMVASGSIPRVDTFSYPSAGAEYLDPHWLFQLGLYGLHSLGGVALSIWVKTLCLLLTFFLLWRTARPESPAPVVAVCVIASAILASERFMVRPEIVTFLLLAGVIWALGRHRAGSNWAGWTIPGLFLLWVNTEGLFIVGFVPIVAAILDQLRDRRLYLIGALSALATIVNPYHIRGALHPLELFTRIDGSLEIYSATIGEFLGPFSSAGGPHPATTLFPFFLAALGLALGLSRKPRWGELFTLAVFLFLSFKARRNLALLAVVSVPILSRWIAIALSRWQSRPLATAGLALSVLAGLGYLVGLSNNRIYATVETNREFGAFEAEVGFPREAAEFCRENGVQGPIFSTLSSGSFLMWAYPTEPVFIDGRLEVHSTEHFSRYLSLLQGGQAWRDADAEFAFNALILDYGEASTLTQERMRDGAWAGVHIDGKAVVLLRRNEANAALIESFPLDRERLGSRYSALAAEVSEAEILPPTPGFLARWFGKRDFPWSEINAGQFFLGIGAHDLAAEQFRRAAFRDPLASTPRVLLASSLNQLRQPSIAIKVVDSAEPLALTGDERDRIAATQGDIYTALAMPREALEAYDRYLDSAGEGPHSAVAQMFRGKARLDLGDSAGAIADLSTALGFAPGFVEGYRFLGLAHERAGSVEAALAELRRYLELGGQSPDAAEAIERLE